MSVPENVTLGTSVPKSSINLVVNPQANPSYGLANGKEQIIAQYSGGTAVDCTIRRKELPVYLGLSLSMIALLRNPKSPYFDPLFPKAIRLSKRAIGFSLNEIIAYMERRKKQS